MREAHHPPALEGLRHRGGGARHHGGASFDGYAFVRIRFPGQTLMFMIVFLALPIPCEVTIVPLFRVFLRFGPVNTHSPGKFTRPQALTRYVDAFGGLKG